MSGRITFHTGDGALQPADAVVVADEVAIDPGSLEASLREGMRRALAEAAARGARSIAVPALGAGPGRLSLQRAAEIQLEEARAHLAGGSGVEEIRFVLAGEPELRVFEAVQDGFRIAEQAQRWSS